MPSNAPSNQVELDNLIKCGGLASTTQNRRANALQCFEKFVSSRKGKEVKVIVQDGKLKSEITIEITKTEISKCIENNGKFV